MTGLKSGETPQECADSAMWQRHLTAAQLVMAAISLYFLLFALQPFAGLFLALLGLAIFRIKARMLNRHIKWHMENDTERPDYSFRP